jgi:hypothetical protein
MHCQGCEFCGIKRVIQFFLVELTDGNRHVAELGLVLDGMREFRAILTHPS